MKRTVLVSTILCAIALALAQSGHRKIFSGASNTISDSFNRATCSSSCGSGDGLGSNWTVTTGDGNSWTTTASGGGEANGSILAYYSNESWVDNNYYGQVTCIDGYDNYSDCGVIVRASTYTNGSNHYTQGYMCDVNFNDPAAYVVRITYSGSTRTETKIATFSIGNNADNDVVYCSAVGTTITMKEAGVLDGTVTDSTFSTGYVGIADALTQGVTSNLGSFSGGTL